MPFYKFHIPIPHYNLFLYIHLYILCNLLTFTYLLNADRTHTLTHTHKYKSHEKWSLHGYKSSWYIIDTQLTFLSNDFQHTLQTR